MTRTLTAIFLAQALALAGCGGDDETNDKPDGSADTDSDTDFDFDTDYPYDLDAGLRCDGGVDIMQPSPDGVGEIPTGVEHCPDDSLHRYAPVPCTETDPYASCSDEDCGECPLGQQCMDIMDGMWDCQCLTPCASDADCATGEVCACVPYNFGAGPYCQPAGCRTDDDCGGFECGISHVECDGLRLSCRTPDDECIGDGQCSDSGEFECGFAEGSSFWECIEVSECD